MDIKDIHNIVVIGLGTMGPGIIQAFAQAGYQVTGYDISPGAPQSCHAVINTSLESLIKIKRITEQDRKQTLSRIQYTDDPTCALKEAQIVIEAVVENKAIKRSVFELIDADAPDDCMIWSNTSTLNIFEALPESRLKTGIIAHWFAPPHIIPLVEVVKGEETASGTVALTMALLKKLDKIPILIEKFVPGFIINRILRNLGREAFFLLDNGYISKEDLDLAVKASIAPRMMVLGLIQRYDFTGLDLSARNLLDKDFFDPPVDNRPKSLQSRIDRGDLGVKTGKGFYDYSDKKLTDVLKNRDEQLLKVMDRLQFCLKEDRLL